MTTDDKIRDEKLQYDINLDKKAAKISALYIILQVKKYYLLIEEE